MRTPDPRPAATADRDLAAGVRHVRDTVPLREMTIACAAALLFVGFSETLTFEVVDVGLGRDAAFIGVLLAVQGLGAVGRRADRGPARPPRRRAAGRRRSGLIVFSLGTTLQISGSLPVVLAGLVLFGIGVPWVLVALFTLLQRSTPAALQGRVYSAVEVLVGVPQMVSIAAGALLVTLVDYRLLLLRRGRGGRRRRRLAADACRAERLGIPLTSVPTMDVSLFFAGTAGSVPTARRGLPALLLRAGGERILFDCGEGTQQQLLRSVGLPDLGAVFITHFHLDHWLGLPGMIKTFDLRARERPLTIYGPPGLAAAVRRPAADDRAHRLPARAGRARAARRDPLRLVPDLAVPGQAPRRGLRLRLRRGRAAGPLRRRRRARRSACARGPTSGASSAARRSTA